MTAPYWLEGKVGFENAIRVLEKNLQILPYSWFKQNIDARFHDQFDLAFRRHVRNTFRYLGLAVSAQHLLQVSNYTPPHLLPPRVSLELQQWMDLQKYPAVTISSIYNSNRGYRYGGECGWMAETHLGTLGLINRPKDHQKTVFIRVNGFVVGAAKKIGI